MLGVLVMDSQIGLGLEMNWQIVDRLVLDWFWIARLEWIGTGFSLDWLIGIELVNRNRIGNGLVRDGQPWNRIGTEFVSDRQ